MKITKQTRLWLGISSVLLVGACLYASVKLVRGYQTAQPRSDADHYLQVNNLKRAYDLYVPSSYSANQPMPLVLAFHGVGGNGSLMEQQTGLNQLAEREGFIVVYPDAVNRHWDARRGSQPETTNDIGFISALIDDLDHRYAIDRRRVYATGFSNGGMFTHRLACDLGDKITAIATVSATIPENLSRICRSTKPTPVLLIHGTNDEAVPYATSSKGLLSAPETFKYWSGHNRCSSPAVLQASTGTSAVHVKTHQHCAKQTQVRLYSIQGGGHEWTGSEAKTPDPAIQADQFNTSKVIWNFFKNL
jgi:polyhydroxybutyrate depolymerase